MADTYLALLEAKEDNIKKVLPEWLTFERFMTLARALDQNPDLKQCSPQSLVGCVIDAANRGWEVGGPSKHCAIVKFKSTAVLIPQWQGRAFLWMRAGAITKLRANVVYTWDAFDWDEGQEILTHKQDLDTDHPWQQLNDIKNIKAAYAIATLPNGDKQYSVVSHAQLVRTMERVKAKNQGELGFGWRDWLPEMCRKTAVHRLDGFLQTPAKMTKEQQAAWAASSMGGGDYDEADIERMKLAEQANADLPDPPKGARKVDGEVQLKKDAPDPKIDEATETDLLKKWKAKGHKTSELTAFLFETFEIEDLSDLKKSQLPKFEAFVL